MATVVVGTGDYMFDVKRNWGNLPVGWEFRDVSGVGVDSQDRLYVYQRGEHPVVVFDREGNFISSWGDRITDDAHHIKIGPDDHAYLADRDGHQVYKFTLDGELVMSLGRKHYPSLQGPVQPPHVRRGLARGRDLRLRRVRQLGGAQVRPRRRAHVHLGVSGHGPRAVSGCPTPSPWTARGWCTWRTGRTTGSRSSPRRRVHPAVGRRVRPHGHLHRQE